MSFLFSRRTQKFVRWAIAVGGILFVGLFCLWLAMAAAGCALPHWRVFQKKVPAALVEKPPAQVEGEKKAARYIELRSAPPVTNPASAVADIHDAAAGLSASLGEPARPVVVEDKEAIISSLRAGLRAKDEQLDKWKAFGRKYAGTPLEGTGVDLAGPTGLLILVGIVAACIACPSLGYVLLRVVPLLWGFFRRTTTAIGEFAAVNPNAGADLKDLLGRRMDQAHKTLVDRFVKPPPPARS